MSIKQLLLLTILSFTCLQQAPAMRGRIDASKKRSNEELSQEMDRTIELGMQEDFEDNWSNPKEFLFNKARRGQWAKVRDLLKIVTLNEQEKQKLDHIRKTASTK